MNKFNEAIPEGIRGHEAFKDITNTGELATAFHARATADTPTLIDLVSDEYKDSTIIKETPDVNAMVKQFIDQQTHLGNSLRLPSEHASDDDRKAFATKVMEKVPSLMFKPDGAKDDELQLIYKSLGKPEAADKYALDEGLEVNEETLKGLSELAFGLNLNNTQLSGVIKHMVDMEANLTAAEKVTAETDAAILTKDWGSAKDQKVAAVVKLAEATKAPAGLIAALKEGGANSDTYKWLDGIATALTGGEGINFDNNDSTPTGSLTPTEAKHQISEIMSNIKHPYRDRSHPQHQEWIKPGGEMTKLQKMANPVG